MNATTGAQAESQTEAGTARRIDGGPEEDGATFRLPEHLRHLLASAIDYLQTRLELAGIEGKEALVVYVKVAAAIFGALALLAFGYIFCLMGLVAVLVSFSGFFWGWVVLALALLHFIGVALCLLIARMCWRRPCFPVTLEEFRKDQEWLSRSRKTGRQL
ncbi:MAG TPA: phage holin family protein [Chthoniobacteraceae bacterium]|nr:phage holin family protein [Chthoniobacteraceae bacterium]